MNSILLVINKPNIEKVEEHQAWLSFQDKLSQISKHYTDMRRLDESSVLINVSNELPAFCSLVDVAHNHKLHYHILFLEEKPQWIDY